MKLSLLKINCFLVLSFILVLLIASFTKADPLKYNNFSGSNLGVGKSTLTTRTVIPVAFHIIKKTDETGEISDSLINKQIYRVADAFKYSNFSFIVYSIDRTTNVPYGQPGYYVITWEDISPNIGLTYVETDTSTGKILFAKTRYNELADANTMEYATIHELGTGLSAAGRSNAISSVWNTSLSNDERNFVPTDLQIILYQYTRPPGNKIVDKDEGF